MAAVALTENFNFELPLLCNLADRNKYHCETCQVSRDWIFRFANASFFFIFFFFLMSLTESISLITLKAL